MSLDVYNRSNEFKPLDYQQQIDLYKKYTELKKSPQITQSQEFNRRISLVIEKAVKQNKSTNEGLNNHHKSTTFEPTSNQEEEKTHSGHETTRNNSENNMNDHKKKSQSTTNIDRESTKQGSLYNLSNKSNRTKSQSPSRANGKNSPSEQQKQQAEVQQHSTEAKKKNGLIKRLSLRFKSHSVDHADDNHADNNKKKSKKQAQTDNSNNNNKQQPPESSDAKSKRNSKNKEMDSYAEMYNNYINAEKTKSNSSLGKPPSSNANRSRNEYEISERKIYGSSYSNYRHDANKRASSSPIDDPNHRDYKIIKVKLENQPKQRSLVSEDDINIQAMRQVFNIFDRDRDGSITIEDVQEVMKSMNSLENELEMPSIDQIREAFEKYDENKNGRIEFNEFLNIEINAAATSPNDPEIAKSVYLPGHVPEVIVKSSRNEHDDDLRISRNLNVKMNGGGDQNGVSSASLDHLAISTANYARSHSNNSFRSDNDNNDFNELFINDRTTNLGHNQEIMKANMKLIFDQFDKDHDGKITRNEINFVMSNLFPDEEITEQDINSMLKAADLDNNGFIDFEEFSNMFNLYGKSVSEGNLESIDQADSIARKSRSPSKRSTKDSKGSPVATRPPPSPSRPESNKPFKSLFKQHSSTKASKEDLSRSTSSNAAASTPATPIVPHPSTPSRTVSSSGRPSGANYKKVVQIFTTSQLMDLKAAFTMFDKNGDQKISETELYEVMCYLGVKTTQEECKAMIRVVDKNRNGYVDYDEFIQMMTHTQIKPLSAADELKKTFDIFDIDGNGFISAEEIKKTMENLGESLTDDEVRDMIKAADINGDGKIDLNEFSGLLSGTSVFHSSQR